MSHARMFRDLRREDEDEQKKNEHKQENQPAQALHGEDNTDKTAEQLQQGGEEVPQVLPLERKLLRLQVTCALSRWTVARIACAFIYDIYSVKT